MRNVSKLPKHEMWAVTPISFMGTELAALKFGIEHTRARTHTAPPKRTTCTAGRRKEQQALTSQLP